MEKHVDQLLEKIQTPHGVVAVLAAENYDELECDAKVTFTDDGCVVARLEESAEGIGPILEELVREAGSELVPGIQVVGAPGNTFVAVDLISRPHYWRGRFTERLEQLA